MRWLAGWVLALALILTVSLISEVVCEPDSVTYYLPLEYGDVRTIWQGNNGKVSHNDVWNRFAFDFSPMPEGTPVVAAADGLVTSVKQDTAGPTGNWKDNNRVVIRHADGNVSEYLHIKQNGAVVKEGQKVMRGDIIAHSGNTGNSRGPHLHFGLRKGDHITGESTPCKFADVDKGTPNEGDRVTSRNFPVRYEKEYNEIERIAQLYRLCSDLGCLEEGTKELKPLAKISIPMSLSILKKTLEKRDQILTEYEKAAEQALDALAKARDAKDIKTAVRIACFGEEDFQESSKKSEFKKAHSELKKEDAYKEIVESLKGETDYRAKFSKAIKTEMQVNDKRKKDPKASYSSAIKSYEQALSSAPEGLITENLKKHIEDLKTK